MKELLEELFKTNGMPPMKALLAFSIRHLGAFLRTCMAVGAVLWALHTFFGNLEIRGVKWEADRDRIEARTNEALTGLHEHVKMADAMFRELIELKARDAVETAALSKAIDGLALEVKEGRDINAQAYRDLLYQLNRRTPMYKGKEAP